MQLNALTLTKYCDRLLLDGKTDEAIAACDHVLNQRLTAVKRYRTLMLKARLLATDSGQWAGEAISCLKEALELTPAGSEARGTVLVAFTAAYAAQGSPSLCRRYRDAFTSERHRVPSLQRFSADVEYNVGLAYHEVDQLLTAEAAYTKTLQLCHSSSENYMISLIPFVQHNLVDVYQELGHHLKAFDCMESAYQQLPEGAYGAQMRNRRAIFSLASGDLQAARLLVESGLGHASCDTRTQAALTMTRARIALSQGDRQAAQFWASEALRLATMAVSSRLSHRIALFLHSLSRGEPE